MEQRREVTLESVAGLYSVAAAAQRLGLTRAALDSRIRRNSRIVVYRIGNERLVSLSDVAAYDATSRMPHDRHGCERVEVKGM